MLKLLGSKALGMLAVLGALIGAAGVAYADAIIKIDGSSTVYPITEAVAEDFQIAKKVVRESDGRYLGHRWRLQEILPW